MITPRTSVHLSHSPTPTVSSFAFLASLEAGVRGILLSVMPLAIYREVGDAAIVSRTYFLVGIVSLIAGLLVPWGTRLIPRRWMMTIGAGLYLVGMVFALVGGAAGLTMALMSNAVATITLWVCLNAYLLDYFVRADIGRAESRRMFYSAAMWTAGPVAGIWLMDVWYPAPFLLAGGFAIAIIVAFWRAAHGRRQADQEGAGSRGEPGVLSGPLRAPAAVDRRLDLRGDPVLRLVGLRRLPADLLHREWSGRPDRRGDAVGHERASFPGAAIAALGAENIRSRLCAARFRNGGGDLRFRILHADPLGGGPGDLRRWRRADPSGRRGQPAVPDGGSSRPNAQRWRRSTPPSAMSAASSRRAWPGWCFWPPRSRGCSRCVVWRWPDHGRWPHACIPGWARSGSRRPEVKTATGAR